MYERTGIEDGPLLDALWDLAECHIATKQFDKADAVAQRLGKLAESSAGPTGPHVGQILGLRGRILFGRRKYRAALTLIERALIGAVGGIEMEEVAS